MATRKINEDALIKQVFKKVNKDLGIAAKTPPAQMKSFNEKLKATPTPFLYRIKDVWKAFAALMAGFFTIGFIIARLTIPTEAVLQTAAVSITLSEGIVSPAMIKPMVKNPAIRAAKAFQTSLILYKKGVGAAFNFSLKDFICEGGVLASTPRSLFTFLNTFLINASSFIFRVAIISPSLNKVE